jgi:hypothetical protein
MEMYRRAGFRGIDRRRGPDRRHGHTSDIFLMDLTSADHTAHR